MQIIQAETNNIDNSKQHSETHTGRRAQAARTPSGQCSLRSVRPYADNTVARRALLPIFVLHFLAVENSPRRSRRRLSSSSSRVGLRLSSGRGSWPASSERGHGVGDARVEARRIRLDSCLPRGEQRVRNLRFAEREPRDGRAQVSRRVLICSKGRETKDEGDERDGSRGGGRKHIGARTRK